MKASSNIQYVPDVFYQHRDKYNNEIKEAARPSFPIDYLIVDMPSGSRVDTSTATFKLPYAMCCCVPSFLCQHVLTHTRRRPFVIEHRQAIGDVQSIEALNARMKQQGPLLAKVGCVHVDAILY